MSERKFRFVSPGVFTNEIDNSQLPKLPQPVGPVIIGRSERGPALRPVQVDSFSDFVEIFGNPIPGGQGGDIWRDGNYTGPAYGTYAAQAWLKNESPVTYVRLLGAQHQNAAAAGEAGWKTSAIPTTAVTTNGGAYGLFIVASSSAANHGSAALAAVFYLNEGMIRLTGSAPSNVTIGATGSNTGAATLVKSIGADYEFKAIISDNSGADIATSAFNFNKDSRIYARNVFNTNPVLTNGDVVAAASLETYWLGQTYERHLEDTLPSVGSVAGDCYGFIAALASGSSDGGDFQMSMQAAQTGWIFAQDTSTDYASYDPDDMQKLFQIIALDDGEWVGRNIKVGIKDIKASTNDFNKYGAFTVVVRRADDSDSKVKILEQFTNCNLDPTSPDYVARKIGDKFATWDDIDRAYTEFGEFSNNSKFIRVAMNDQVAAGLTDPVLLPFGFYGPLKFNNITLAHGGTTATTSFIKGKNAIPFASGTSVGNGISAEGIAAFTCSVAFPTIPVRVSASIPAISSNSNAFWGADTSLSGSTRFNASYVDLVKAFPAAVDSFNDGALTTYSFKFSLDDLVGVANDAYWSATARTSGVSFSAVSSSWQEVLDQGYDRFTIPLFGGFDGLDITEKEPFRNTGLSGGSETTNYAYNTIKRAIDTCKDPEVAECNLMAVPGVTNSGLTGYLIDVCEERADCLGVIDLAGDYVPSTENTTAESGRIGDVDTMISNLKARGINNSYGCAYTTWVQIRDNISDSILWVPPSVAAIGAMAYSEKHSEVFFSPAGFTRGGLSDGAAGLPVTGVRSRFTSANRDDLYAANINPIATFPAEGIVIWGQKTLQVTPSALDRVNVRRLMIYVKKEISRMASRLLFEQNVRDTWIKFTGMTDPFLASVRSRFGLTDFKVILDETTTTPDLVDRNILYAKILLKPARSIEYIAIDFVISNTGSAGFAD